MAFSAMPMVPGDLFESAAKLAAACDGRFARLAEPAERAALLDETWGEVARLGWPAVMVPEATGGAGGELRDVAALAEGSARSALALPIGSACGVVPMLLGAAGEAAAELLAGIAAGTHRTAAAIAPIHADGAGARLTMRRAGGPILAAGALIGVECPPAPTHLLIAGDIDGEASLLVVTLAAHDAEVRRHERIDFRPTLDLHVPDERPLVASVLACGPAMRDATARAIGCGAFLACVEAAAAMGALLEQTIAYLSSRVQFDAPLSTFQVLRHRVAELYAEQERARAHVADLIERIAAGEWPEREISLAKVHFGEAARRFGATTIQLHGGMGMTEELAATRLAKRLLMIEFEYGDSAFHEARLLAAA